MKKKLGLFLGLIWRKFETRKSGIPTEYRLKGRYSVHGAWTVASAVFSRLELNAMREGKMTLREFFRKHDYSIEDRVDTGIESFGSDGVLRPVRYLTFTCSKCGKTLALDHWQMKVLPWRMKRGCKGSLDRLNAAHK